MIRKAYPVSANGGSKAKPIVAAGDRPKIEHLASRKRAVLVGKKTGEDSTVADLYGFPMQRVQSKTKALNLQLFAADVNDVLPGEMQERPRCLVAGR